MDAISYGLLTVTNRVVLPLATSMSDDQKAVLACVGLLIGSVLVLTTGYAIGRVTGRTGQCTERDVVATRPFPSTRSATSAAVEQRDNDHVRRAA